jgi:two-component system response regulator AtoC
VIITDMYMPEMDGLSFLKAMRGNEAWARVRVVMLSAESNEVDAARKSGANAYMLKPLDMDHFNKVLRKWGLIG